MNKYLTGTAVALAFMGLGALMAGFVPGPGSRAPEWRGRMVASPTEARLPLSFVVLRPADRMSLSRVPEEPAAALDAASLGDEGTASPLYLDGWTVGIVTEHGPTAASAPRGPAPGAMPPRRPLPSLIAVFGGEPGLTSAVPAGEGEALTPDGMPLRWVRQGPGPGGPVCALPSLPTLELPESVLPEPGFRSLSMSARASRYRETAERYARKFGLDTSLVLAIMQVESGFNPSLISSRDAHGLMQVVPATAGDEVHRWLGRSGLPTASELLNPDNNIRYGTSYLHLLRTRHLEGIRDPQSLEYCVIAAYNGGSGAVLRHFGRTREEAFAAINELSPQEVLTRLTESFPARETRSFVNKVLNTRAMFLAHGGVVASAEAKRVSAPTASVAPSLSESRVEVEKRQRAQLEAMRRWSERAEAPAAAVPRG